eukprot:m.95748 g.95748  ORF g.95748 m.95748 type:complete len:252 (+) comp26846_c0_seq1:926-1681(+)
MGKIGMDWHRYYNDMAPTNRTGNKSFPHGSVPTWNVYDHGVNNAEGAFRWPSALYRLNHSKADGLAEMKNLISKIHTYQGQIQSFMCADEVFCGRDPNRGTETCTWNCLTWSNVSHSTHCLALSQETCGHTFTYNRQILCMLACHIPAALNTLTSTPATLTITPLTVTAMRRRRAVKEPRVRLTEMDPLRMQRFKMSSTSECRTSLVASPTFLKAGPSLPNTPCLLTSCPRPQQSCWLRSLHWTQPLTNSM